MMFQKILYTATLATWIASTRLAAAQDAAEIATARDLFREGARLAMQGRWADARDRYERSLKLKRAALTLYSLGVAQRNEGRVAESLESFRAFLAEPPTAGTELYTAPAREAVLELEKQVATIVVKVRPSNLPAMQVALDGVAVPSTMLAQPRLVNPGSHTVMASAPGHRSSQTTATLAEGTQLTVVLALEPIAPLQTPAHPAVSRGTPPTASARSPAEPAGRSRHPASWICLGGGAALSVAGLGVGLAGLKTASQAPTNHSPEAARARSMALAGDIMGGVGLGVAGAGVVLLLVKTGARRPSNAWVSPFGEGNAAGVRFRF